MPYKILETPEGNAFSRNKRRNSYAQYKQSKRQELIALFGGKCVRCEFDDYRALQLDHKIAVGHKRKSFSSATLVRMMQKDEKGMREIYQLLCANCNWIKRHKNNETNRGFRRHAEDRELVNVD